MDVRNEILRYLTHQHRHTRTKHHLRCSTVRIQYINYFKMFFKSVVENYSEFSLWPSMWHKSCHGQILLGLIKGVKENVNKYQVYGHNIIYGQIGKFCHNFGTLSFIIYVSVDICMHLWPNFL